ncbi:8589_t:CDS:2 [Funneliformis geosporum]|uniref:8589_t:CDS:1 n=1 Tax=Funneliformis geosporum TaxID=1117311 RepID=A0A9W4SL22_9GLOM|nr:8589_t:CDS:2 [Funneliformis geosporum]
MLKAKYNKKVYNQDFYKVIYKYNCDDSQLVNYLKRRLYPSKASWARAFSNNVFIIDIQSNSRCESVNATFKRLLHNSNTTLIDLFFTVEERLMEEQDNNEYANWQNALPCTQSTIVSSAFANIIEELKLFTLPQIQKIHYSKMEMAFSYDAKLLDQTYINNETLQDWSFADGFIENQEIRQITF